MCQCRVLLACIVFAYVLASPRSPISFAIARSCVWYSMALLKFSSD
jgi:hypothetical protein